MKSLSAARSQFTWRNRIISNRHLRKVLVLFLNFVRRLRGNSLFSWRADTGATSHVITIRRDWWCCCRVRYQLLPPRYRTPERDVLSFLFWYSKILPVWKFFDSGQWIIVPKLNFDLPTGVLLSSIVGCEQWRCNSSAYSVKFRDLVRIDHGLWTTLLIICFNNYKSVRRSQSPIRFRFIVNSEIRECRHFYLECYLMSFACVLYKRSCFSISGINAIFG